jgi:SAM-dependent methyltransferase
MMPQKDSDSSVADEEDAFGIRKFLADYSEKVPENQRRYIDTHYKRFLRTLSAVPPANSPEDLAIEIGTYGMFPVAMRNLLGYARVDGTIYENKGAHPVEITRKYFFDKWGRDYRLFDLDLERMRIPIEDETYDFVLSAEVIEHFATDPNFFFFEANRILKVGGKFLVTTPNVACSENIFRILWRQIPNRYYFYRKDFSSDRHNLEYGPDLLKKVLENAGFSIIKMWTEDFWAQPRPDIEQLLRDAGFPDSLRGDDLLFLCVKTGEPGERLPDFLYA